MIRLGDGSPLDLDRLIETRLLIQANSGGGKSWAIRRLLEQTHGRVQQIVLDIEGAARYPDRLSKEEIAAATGYESSGGAFNNALGRLRTLELIEGRGDAIRASEALFG